MYGIIFCIRLSNQGYLNTMYTTKYDKQMVESDFSQKHNTYRYLKLLQTV